MNEIRYQPLWPVLYIMCGCIFSMIFFLGYYVLSELSYLFYLIFSSGLIGLGLVMRRRPCVKYDANNFIVTNLFGGTKHHFSFENKAAVTVKDGKFYYLNRQINVNRFMMRSEDWNRAVVFFSDDWGMQELVED